MSRVGDFCFTTSLVSSCAHHPSRSRADFFSLLVQEYLAAPDHEKKAFHERGLRHVGAEDVQMPSGRILTASTTVSTPHRTQATLRVHNFFPAGFLA